MSGRQSESRNRPDRSPPPLPRAPDSTAPLHSGSTPEWWESPQFLVPVAFVVLALLAVFLWLFLATFSRQTSALGTGNETAATDSTEQSAEGSPTSAVSEAAPAGSDIADDVASIVPADPGSKEETVVSGEPESVANPTTDSAEAPEPESKGSKVDTVEQGGKNTARPRGKAFSISRTTVGGGTTGVEGRLAASGAKSGDIQISLAWDNRNDIDLHVQTPSGEWIHFGNKTSRCGGILDVDMNVSAETEQPVENIHWATGKAPRGNFVVAVNHYSLNCKQDPTKFVVLISVDGKKKMRFQGTISSRQRPKIVHRFRRQ